MSDSLSAVPVLDTARLRLRTVRRSDLEQIYLLHSDSRAMRYWSFPTWSEKQQALDWFEQRSRIGEREEVWPWAITLAGADELIGLVTLFAINRGQQRAETGYQLHPSQWGQGYAQEALRAALAYGFDALDLRRVEADIDPRNEPSCRLVQRIGFQREGYLRERWLVNGEITDTALYGLLKRDFAR
ncbi:GNAT family protein [Tahibacter sp.]|uniref:GNAT family N-acetyltransferase n=1 Tax=Tahibacter sp. TaxID=2056211 RepID=UPI0028C4B622|nr:GNAT family protein [Tahibacter sp.]